MDTKKLLENGQFPIEGIIVNKDTKEKELVSIGGRSLFDDTELNIIRFEPNTIRFLGEKFRGEFIFSKQKLSEITLKPILQDIKSPGYPDETYEKAKYEFCANLLNKYLETETNQDNTETYYKKQGFYIGCDRILSGHAQNCGGNIHISFSDKYK